MLAFALDGLRPAPARSDHLQRHRRVRRGEGPVELGQVLRVERQVERGPVLPDVRRLGRLGDGDHALAAAAPRPAPPGPASRPCAAATRLSARWPRIRPCSIGRVGHDRHAAAPGSQGRRSQLDAAPGEVVEHLVGLDAPARRGAASSSSQVVRSRSCSRPSSGSCRRAPGSGTPPPSRRGDAARASAAGRGRSGRSGAAAGSARRRRPCRHARRCRAAPCSPGRPRRAARRWPRRPAPRRAPSAYISAVSISVRPRSSPSRSAASSGGAAGRRLGHHPGAEPQGRDRLAAGEGNGAEGGGGHGWLLSGGPGRPARCATRAPPRAAGRRRPPPRRPAPRGTGGRGRRRRGPPRGRSRPWRPGRRTPRAGR